MSRRVGPESHRGLSLLYWAPILSVEAKVAEMDAAGIDLAVLSRGCGLRSALPVIAPVQPLSSPAEFRGWHLLGPGVPRDVPSVPLNPRATGDNPLNDPGADLGEDGGHLLLRVRKGARKAKTPLTPA